MPRLTVDPQLDALPVWTPDGKRLVWASSRAGPLNLYWQAADGTGKVDRLTESPNQQRPSAFTPDGQRLMLSETPGRGTQQDLGVLPVNGDRRVAWLLKTTFSELNGEISPNGRWLAYQSNESGQFEIYVRPFPGVDEGRWVVSTGGGQQPLWARSGRELFYLAPDGSLMGVPVDVGQAGASFERGEPVKLVEGQGYFSAAGTPNLGRTYDVTPDVTRFLRIKVAERASDAGAVRPGVVMVVNWHEELKRLVPTK
jgi:eukaryotic-like serine/threonine-protein kinase